MLFTLVHWIIGFISTQEYFNIFFLKVYLEYVKLWTQMKSCSQIRKLRINLCVKNINRRGKRKVEIVFLFIFHPLFTFCCLIILCSFLCSFSLLYISWIRYYNDSHYIWILDSDWLRVAQYWAVIGQFIAISAWISALIASSTVSLLGSLPWCLLWTRFWPTICQ